MEQPQINVQSLQNMLDRGGPVTVVDVRPAAERAEWIIPGSIHVDIYDDLKAGRPNVLAHLDLPDDRPVVTVCGAGKASLLATQQLRDRGFEAFSLTGGMQAWSLAWNSADVPISHSDAQVVQIRRTGKGCLSYLIGSHAEALVIDPSLEPDVYTSLAQRYGWRIAGVLETHIHADHLSRARILAEQVDCTLYLPPQDRVSYPFQAVRDCETVTVGSLTIRALHTPGHTMESTCYLLDRSALFTGDTLFLNTVGRPDLEATSAEAKQRAHLLYASLQRLRSLADSVLVLPGHSSEPVDFDGKPVSSTLGEVLAHTELLHLPEDRFVERILMRSLPTPPNHQRIVDLNETGTWPANDPTELEAGANRCAVG